MSAPRLVSLLEVDPDLGQLVYGERRVLAGQQLRAEVRRVEAGPLYAERVADPEDLGVLVLTGVACCEVLVSNTVSLELLGPGDVLRPWGPRGEQPFLELIVRWSALTDCRIAMLDHRFAARLEQWPEINCVLIDRINNRSQRLATTQAISQLTRVDRRLLALLWHLAERWGRVTSDGVAVPLMLSHRMLGQLVGAQRPTVSTAIAELADRDELVRRPDGTWLLTGAGVGAPAPETERVVPNRRRLVGRHAEKALEAPMA
jgi:hypothetical protein